MGHGTESGEAAEAGGTAEGTDYSGAGDEGTEGDANGQGAAVRAWGVVVVGDAGIRGNGESSVGGIVQDAP